MQGVTLEYLKKYNLKIIQPAKGYRYSIDSFLLADFLSKIDFQSAIEVGGGCGIVTFLLSRIKDAPVMVEIFEIQKNLFNCLKENYKINTLKNLTLKLRNEDAKYAMPSFKPQLVFLNPPFRVTTQGKVSKVAEKALARHEYKLNLNEIFKIFNNFGGYGSKFAMVHIFEREIEINELARKNGLFIEKILYIKPFRESITKHVIFLFSKQKCKTEKSSIFVYDFKNKYSQKMNILLG